MSIVKNNLKWISHNQYNLVALEIHVTWISHWVLAVNDPNAIVNSLLTSCALKLKRLWQRVAKWSVWSCDDSCQFFKLASHVHASRSWERLKTNFESIDRFSTEEFRKPILSLKSCLECWHISGIAWRNQIFLEIRESQSNWCRTKSIVRENI